MPTPTPLTIKRIIHTEGTSRSSGKKKVRDVNQQWWKRSTLKIKGEKLEKINDIKWTWEQTDKGPRNRSPWAEQKSGGEEGCEGWDQQITVISWMVSELTDKSWVLFSGKKAAERT